MSDITLERVETQEQIDTLCSIAQRVWHETFDALLPEGQTDYMIQKFQSDAAVKDQMAHQNYRYYLAKLGKEYGGFVGYAPWYEGKAEMYLSKVYLLPEARGQGIVRVLFNWVEQEACKEGLSKIRLTVNKRNTHAAQVYAHYGYETVEAVQTDIGSGYVMDDYVMVKHIWQPGESLQELSREQLLQLIILYSKNWLAMDGVWFQSVERKRGMEEAMFHDVEAWKRFTVTEARRIRNFLQLPEHPGLEGLAQALRYRFYANLSHYTLTMQGDALLLRVLECPVQQARTRKSMGLHPCKPAGLEEYAGFARTIDDRIQCSCVSCYPDTQEEGCACAWKFTLEQS